MWIFYAPTYRWPWSGDWQQTVDTNAATPQSLGQPRTGAPDPDLHGELRAADRLNDVLLSQQPGATEADSSRASENHWKPCACANLRIRALKASCELAPSTTCRRRPGPWR